MAAPFVCTAVDQLPAAPAGWYAVDYAPLPDGSLACLQATTDIATIVRHNHDLISQGLYERQQPYLVAGSRARLLSCRDPGRVAEFSPDYPFPAFDRLPDGGWIVVNARCPPNRPNAFLLAEDGSVVRRFPVGDGVEQVQTDDLGGVWVSHFDEGLNDELGSAGLAHFDASCRVTWRANYDDRVPPVDDCYALNVVGGVAWACYYSDFPILRVGPDGEHRVWANKVRGAAALAVDGEHVVLFGGYEDRRSRIALLRLHGRGAEWVGELQLTEPEVPRSQVVGRGDTIHLTGEGMWRRFTVAEVVEAVAAAGDMAAPDHEG